MHKLSCILQLVFLLICYSSAIAWDKDKQWLLDQVGDLNGNPGYLSKVMQKADNMWDANGDHLADPGSAAITQTNSPGNQRYWLGNPNAPVDYTINDFFTNFNPFGDFFQCLNLKWHFSWSWSHGLRIKLKLSMPEEIVHTHPMFQNRYEPVFTLLKYVGQYFGLNVMPSNSVPPVPYLAMFQADMMRFVPYGSPSNPIPYPGAYDPFKLWITPVAMGQAWAEQENMVLSKYPFYFPSAPSAPIFSPPNINLDASSKDYRYASSPLANMHGLDYSVLPTFWAIAWRFIFPAMYMLPSSCRPDTKIVYPYDSDNLDFFYQTRDPFLAPLIYSQDQSFVTDWNQWFSNPKACTEYKMSQNPAIPNIPYDMYDAPLPLLPDLLTPMPASDIGKYKRMCTAKIGSNIPWTIQNSPQGTDMLTAVQNIEKAMRLSNAHYKEVIVPDPNLKTYYRSKPINKSEDTFQFTYHDKAPTMCQHFGTVGELFPKNDAMSKKDDYGLYSATIWRRKSCTMDVGQFFGFLALILGGVVP